MSEDLRRALEAAREELLWFSNEHKCCPLDEDTMELIDAALAAQPAEPVAWAQLGMRNGHTYVRMHYEGHLYPPPKDVQRNLNLVPLYAAPPAPQPAGRALTDEQIEKATGVKRDTVLFGIVRDVTREVERAHNIKSEGE